MESTDHGPDADALMHDENAFGLWVSWYDAEDAEYAQSADKFPTRLSVLGAAFASFLDSFSPGSGARAIDLGTALYLEIGDGEQTEDLIGWMRSLRAYLLQGDWRTFAVITHGGRWVRSPEACLQRSVGEVQVAANLGPSEPFRKAIIAEAMSHGDEDEGEEGWGPGLFVDAEALETLGKKLKNAPTALRHAGECFYRIGA